VKKMAVKTNLEHQDREQWRKEIDKHGQGAARTDSPLGGKRLAAGTSNQGEVL